MTHLYLNAYDVILITLNITSFREIKLNTIPYLTADK